VKIYVGNLSYDVTEDELRTEFAPFGKVESISIPTDRYSNKPRGLPLLRCPSSPRGRRQSPLSREDPEGKDAHRQCGPPARR